MNTLPEILARWDSEILRRIAARLFFAPTGCWEANFSKRGGYPLIDINGTTRQVHRVMYEAMKGPIPNDLQIDHLCRNRTCCNPDHLEAVSPRINTLRGTSFAALHAKKTHCLRGHELTLDNCRPHKLRRGSRSCITCENAAARDRRAARRNSANEGVIR